AGGRVEESLLAKARDEAEHDTQYRLEGDGHPGELRRRGGRCPDDVHHRPSGEGRAEIEGEDSFELQPLLHDEWLIEVEVRAQPVSRRLAHSPFPTQGDDGIAR